MIYVTKYTMFWCLWLMGLMLHASHDCELYAKVKNIYSSVKGLLAVYSRINSLCHSVQHRMLGFL